MVLPGHTHDDRYVLASSYTAADVLAKLLTVDGSGTGLDADLLDGNHASAFAVSGHNHDHGALSGLADDDHEQYAQLSGRSGGQTLIGGTGSGDDLTLKASSDEAGGDIRLVDSADNILGYIRGANGVWRLGINADNQTVALNGETTGTNAERTLTLIGPTAGVKIARIDAVNGAALEVQQYDTTPTLIGYYELFTQSGNVYLRDRTGTATVLFWYWRAQALFLYERACGLKNVTAPSASQADHALFYAADQQSRAGDSAFHVRSEAGQIYSFGTQAQLGGGLALPIATKTADATLSLAEHTVLANAASGAITLALPTAASAYNSTTGVGQIYTIKKIDSSANTVTVDGNGSETIDGAATQVLAAQWAVVRIQSNGSAWYII